jgi:hypothetical protein
VAAGVALVLVYKQVAMEVLAEVEHGVLPPLVLEQQVRATMVALVAPALLSTLVVAAVVQAQ